MAKLRHRKRQAPRPIGTRRRRTGLQRRVEEWTRREIERWRRS